MYLFVCFLVLLALGPVFSMYPSFRKFRVSLGSSWKKSK